MVSRKPLTPMMTVDEFRRLRAKTGETRPSFQDADLRRLHTWGDLFYFGTLPSEERAPRDRDLPPGQRSLRERPRDSALMMRWIVDPRWVARPVYEIAWKSTSVEHGGRAKPSASNPPTSPPNRDGGRNNRLRVASGLRRP
ncbi:MAG: hypothetical protein BroJett003_10420 [Planctomycetota bacterium]|nr:MAG: hypothetical protein BroJett003_10420 [Planctomycetota bacterium]